MDPMEQPQPQRPAHEIESKDDAREALLDATDFVLVFRSKEGRWNSILGCRYPGPALIGVLHQITTFLALSHRPELRHDYLEGGEDPDERT